MQLAREQREVAPALLVRHRPLDHENGVAPVVEPGPNPPTARGAVVTVLDESGHELMTTVLPTGPLDDPLALAADR